MESFRYHRPESLLGALSLIQDYSGEARPLAGGQSLMPLLGGGMVQPAALVDLAGIPSLYGIDWDREAGLTIGAMVTQREIETSAVVREKCPALSQALSRVASVPVRNLGTLTGNLCHAGPGADPPAILMATGAMLQVASHRGLRIMPVEDLFSGPYETALAEGELVIAVMVPPAGNVRAVYLKHAVRAIDPAIVGVAAAVKLQDGLVQHIRIGMVGAGPKPFRARNAEGALRGRPLDSRGILDAAAAATADSEPMSDGYSSADYRRKMVPVFVRRALEHLAQSPPGRGDGMPRPHGTGDGTPRPSRNDHD